jgi:hypothetical protein
VRQFGVSMVEGRKVIKKGAKKVSCTKAVSVMVVAATSQLTQA